MQIFLFLLPFEEQVESLSVILGFFPGVPGDSQHPQQEWHLRVFNALGC